MAEYIEKQQARIAVDKRIAELKNDPEFTYPKAICVAGVKNHINSIPPANVVEREKILDFIEDNRPTDVQTDWERGCAYICDEIEKLLR